MIQLMLLLITLLYIISFRLRLCNYWPGCNLFISLLQNSGRLIVLVKSLLKYSPLIGTKFAVFLAPEALSCSEVQVQNVWSFICAKILKLNHYNHDDICYQNSKSNHFLSASIYKYLQIMSGSRIIQLVLNCNPWVLKASSTWITIYIVFHWIRLVRRMSHKMSLPCKDLLWRVTFGEPCKRK